MKLSLRNLALAGAVAATGAMFAQDAPTVTLQWSKDVVVGKNDNRFGVGHGGKVYVNDKANGKIMAYDANGATEFVALEGVGTAISVDDAGNLLVNKGFPGAATCKTLAIVAPDGTVKDLELTMPDGVAEGRVDQIGRVVGNMLSEEGAFFYLTNNTVKDLVMVYVQNGAQATADGIEYYSAPTEATFNTSTIAQPMFDFETTLGLGDEACSAAAFRQRANQSVNYYDGSAWATWTKPAGSYGGEGFDVFTLGGVDYQIQPLAITAGGWASNSFCIADAEGNIIYTDELPDLADGAQTFGSFNVEVVDENTVNVYRWLACGKSCRAAMYTVKVAGDEPGEPLYITGDMTQPSWNPGEAVEFTYAGGVYTYDFGHETKGRGFKVSTAKGTWDEFNAGCIGCALVVNETVAIDPNWNTNNNLTIPANGTYKLIIDLKNNTMKLEGEKDPAAAPEEATIYLRGDFNNWGNDTGYQDMLDNYKFTCDGIEGANRVYALYVEKEIKGSFKIADHNYNPINFGTVNVDVPVMVGPIFECAPGSMDNNFKLSPAGLSNVTFRLRHSGSDEPSTLVVEPGNTVGISNVEIDDNAPAVYYNLQGVEVTNPANGLYIRVQGGKAAKVLVK